MNGDGSSYNCATTAGGPGAFNNWSSANNAIGAGTVLAVDGTWNFSNYFVVNRGGTAASPARITSYNWSNPARLQGSVGTFLIHLFASYLEFDHFNIQNTGYGAYLGNTANGVMEAGISFHHNYISDSDNALSVRQVDGADIYDNVAVNIGSTVNNLGQCLYSAQGARNVRFFRNQCVAKPNVYRSHCFHVFHDEPPGPPANISYFNNLCVGFTENGAYSGSTNVSVVNNTFYATTGTSGGAAAGFICDYSGASGEFSNNIVVSTGTWMTSIDPNVCNITFSNNIYYSTTSPGSEWFRDDGVGGSSQLDWNTWSQSYEPTGSYVADPMLVNPSVSDFHLQPGSPAIDKGLTIPTVTIDYEGTPRPQGSAYDMGAYEQ